MVHHKASVHKVQDEPRTFHAKKKELWSKKWQECVKKAQSQPKGIPTA